MYSSAYIFFFQAEDGVRAGTVTGVHTCALPIFADGRRFDLLLAVNEAAVNTLVHGDGQGVLRMWLDDGELVCELSDGWKSIADPLAGRRRPRSEERRVGKECRGRGVPERAKEYE